MDKKWPTLYLSHINLFLLMRFNYKGLFSKKPIARSFHFEYPKIPFLTSPLVFIDFSTYKGYSRDSNYFAVDETPRVIFWALCLLWVVSTAHWDFYFSRFLTGKENKNKNRKNISSNFIVKFGWRTSLLLLSSFSAQFLEREFWIFLLESDGERIRSCEAEILVAAGKRSRRRQWLSAPLFLTGISVVSSVQVNNLSALNFGCLL